MTATSLVDPEVEFSRLKRKKKKTKHLKQPLWICWTFREVQHIHNGRTFKYVELLGKYDRKEGKVIEF